MDKTKLPKAVLAFDPGGSTGWASWEQEREGYYNGGQLGPHDHHTQIWEMLLEWYVTYGQSLIIITESFDFRNSVSTEGRSGLNLISREYIGVIRVHSELCGVPVFQQKPAEAKNLVKDSKLEKLSLLPENKHENRHEIDAKRHLIFFQVTNSMFKGPVKDSILQAWKS